MNVRQEPRRRMNEAEHYDSLADWREQVEQALRGRENPRDLAKGTAGAYEDLLDSLFFYYGESMRAVEKGIRRG
jgi:hypothetical protein